MIMQILFELLENRRLLTGTVSQQIIVDQFGWRADAASKVALFADPIVGQNNGTAYIPGATFRCAKFPMTASFSLAPTVAWNGGATDSVSGDKVWSGDFSSLKTPGNYYVYDPTNNLRSYSFAPRQQHRQRRSSPPRRACFIISAPAPRSPRQFGGNWTHAIDHVGPNQDTQSHQWQNGAARPRQRRANLSGGWFDAGDYNKYIPFTTSDIWNMLQAYDFNPGAFRRQLQHPRKRQRRAGSTRRNKMGTRLDAEDAAQRRLGHQSCFQCDLCDRQLRSFDRHAAALLHRADNMGDRVFAASMAHASRMFAAFDTVYPGYSAKLLAAAQNAWTYLQTKPTMFPANGSTTAAAGWPLLMQAQTPALISRTRMSRRRRACTKPPAAAAYKNYFEANYNNSAAADNGFMPLQGSWPHFDAIARAGSESCVHYLRNHFRRQRDDRRTDQNGDREFRRRPNRLCLQQPRPIQ